jgi:hypothetical protein
VIGLPERHNLLFFYYQTVVHTDHNTPGTDGHALMKYGRVHESSTPMDYGLFCSFFRRNDANKSLISGPTYYLKTHERRRVAHMTERYCSEIVSSEAYHHAQSILTEWEFQQAATIVHAYRFDVKPYQYNILKNVLFALGIIPFYDTSLWRIWDR